MGCDTVVDFASFCVEKAWDTYARRLCINHQSIVCLAYYKVMCLIVRLFVIALPNHFMCAILSKYSAVQPEITLPRKCERRQRANLVPTRTNPGFSDRSRFPLEHGLFNGTPVDDSPFSFFPSLG